VFSHIVLECKGSWKKATSPRGGHAKLTDLFPREVAGLPKGGTMALDPPQLSNPTALPDVSARHFAQYYTYSNRFNTFEIGSAPKELEALWREVLALLVRRHRQGR
jgi:hypothetical protein